MNSESTVLDQWRFLRNLVFEAAGMKVIPEIPAATHGHAVVVLIKRYFADRQDAILDEAARLVAISKPGIDRDFAERHYWLVLDKS